MCFVCFKVSIKENEEEEGLMIDTSAGSVKAQAQVPPFPPSLFPPLPPLPPIKLYNIVRNIVNILTQSKILFVALSLMILKFQACRFQF